MNRRFDKQLLSSALSLRARVLKVLNPASNTKVAAAALELRTLVMELRAAARRSAGLPEARAIRRMSDALAIAFYVSKWVHSTSRADPSADRYLKAAQFRAASLQDALAKPLAFAQTQQGLTDWAGQVIAAKEPAAGRALLAALAKVPQPVLYSRFDDRYAAARRRRHAAPTTHANGSPPVSSPPTPLVKLDFTIDDQPLATPQAIRSGRQFGLGVHADAIRCPADQRILELDYVTTMAPSDFWITPFALEMPGREPRTSAAGSGQLILRASQSLKSPPASFRIRARFVNPDRSATTPAVVIGYNEMRLSALDSTSFPERSRYPTVDIQIPKIIAELHAALPELAPSDLDDFVECLTCLGAYCGMVQQTGVFKTKNVDEKREFQQHLLQFMRQALGDDVREEETLAAGRLDLRYRRIVIELKVEDTIKDRDVLRTKYISQPAQYSASSIPLAITCILDLTEKVHPPANIANNITLETPTVHGFENSAPAYPTKVAVVVIDGNLKLPSEYSKASLGMSAERKLKPGKKPSGRKSSAKPKGKPNAPGPA